MANEEHLAILRRGVKAWNQWRAGSHEVNPDLTSASLLGVDLREVNLKGAVLRAADLRRIDCSKADLRGVDFTQALLTGAIFAGADLGRVNLQKAILAEAVFTQTIFYATIFVDVDLRAIRELSTAEHFAPSNVGIDTLYRSKGHIPEAFLRGCGVPDSMIEYARSLVAAERSIDYYSVFISYSSHDDALARRLHADLQAAGVRCWYAPENLKIGDSIFRGNRSRYPLA